MATIREIARLTNVSPTTVSNVIHGRTDKVSVENVRRIQQALQDHHYFPKYGLEVMQKGKTRIVGIVAYIRHYYKSLIDDAFYGSIIGALEKEIRQVGYYTMLLIENDRDAIYQAVKSWNMSGLITITFPWQDYHCQQSAEKAIKAVIVSLHWPTGIPKSHDLSFLLNQIHNYISIPDAIGDAADALRS